MVCKLKCALLATCLVLASLSPLSAQESNDAASEREQLIQVLTEMLDRLKDDQQKDSNAVEDAKRSLSRFRWVQQAQLLPRADFAEYEQLQDLQYAEQARWQGFYDTFDQYQPSRFWLGVQCEPADEYKMIFADTNEITVKGGLRVIAVTEDSPAESAGIEVDDVLAFFNGQPVNDIQQLTLAINQNGDKKAAISVVRKQESQELDVTPKLREDKPVQAYFNKAQLDYAAQLLSNNKSLPPGYEARLTFRPNESITLHVQKDDQTWQAARNKIDDLPNDVRGFAANTLEQADIWFQTTTPGAPAINQQVYWNYVLPKYREWNRTAYYDLGVDQKAQNVVGHDQQQEASTEERLERIEKQLLELTDYIHSIKK